MATATNFFVGEGSVSVTHDDTPGSPVALQISIDLAALSVRMTRQQAFKIANELLRPLWDAPEEEVTNEYNHL